MEEACPRLKCLQVFEETSHSPCQRLVFSLGVGKIVQSPNPDWGGWSVGQKEMDSVLGEWGKRSVSWDAFQIVCLPPGTSKTLAPEYQAGDMEEGMGAHSSILAQRILWTEEPGVLPSTGSHRVELDWSDLAAAEALHLNTGSFHFRHAAWFDNQNCFFCTSSKLKGHFLFPSLNASTKWKCGWPDPWPLGSGCLGSDASPPTYQLHQFSSDQSLSRVRLFPTSWTAARQASLSITNSGACSDSCRSQWCHPTISSSVVPFSFCLQSFPASGSFQMSQFFASGGQSITASASVLPMNTQDWSPLGWSGWISLQSKGLSRDFSNTTVQKHQFFGAQLSLWSNSHICTWPLEKP